MNEKKANKNLIGSFVKRKERASLVVKELEKLFPDASIALKFSNNWELLVAVMLSAQCTDKKVNEVTEKLFIKYPSLENYVAAKQGEFEQDIRSTGFYKNKTKNILASAQIIKNEYDGYIPCSMEKLLELPGVARKTANIILEIACGKVEGIVVDTHVKRFAQKLDLSDYNDPVKIERDLMMLLPKSQWSKISYRLIEYGRQICPARKHDCSKHPLSIIYPPAAGIWPRS